MEVDDSTDNDVRGSGYETREVNNSLARRLALLRRRRGIHAPTSFSIMLTSPRTPQRLVSTPTVRTHCHHGVVGVGCSSSRRAKHSGHHHLRARSIPHASAQQQQPVSIDITNNGESIEIHLKGPSQAGLLCSLTSAFISLGLDVKKADVTEKDGKVRRLMGGRMDGWMDGWMGGWVDGWRGRSLLHTHVLTPTIMPRWTTCSGWSRKMGRPQVTRTWR